MGPHGVWQEWDAEISRILTSVGVWRRRTLALFSLAVAAAKHCGVARVPSTTRRFERLLASKHLDVRAARSEVVKHVLGSAGGQTRWLALDETHQGRTETGARLGMLALRLVYRERAIPLAWVCSPPGDAPAPFPVLIGRLIDEAAGLL